MKTILLAAAAIIFSGLACADVPAGADSVNGSFVRMLNHGPGVAPMSATGGDSTAGAHRATLGETSCSRNWCDTNIGNGAWHHRTLLRFTGAKVAR